MKINQMEKEDNPENKISWSENPDGYNLYKPKKSNEEYSDCQKIILEIEKQNKDKEKKSNPRTF